MPPFGSSLGCRLGGGAILLSGTPHGLASSSMTQRYGNARDFTGAILGFPVMAVVALRTWCRSTGVSWPRVRRERQSALRINGRVTRFATVEPWT